MRKPKHSHSDRDKIMTPTTVAKYLIRKIPYAEEDSWCDPCLGGGVFFNNFPTDNKFYYEKDLGLDYFESKGRWDWIVTNIPFSKPNEFILKMANDCIKGFGILCLANSMTAKRIEKIKTMNLFINSITILYIKSWGFGYRTDFYVFTRNKVSNIDYVIF